MNKTLTTRPIAPAHPEPAAVQAVVNRRLALRLGLTMPVAAVVATLAGIGPQTGRVGR